MRTRCILPLLASLSCLLILSAVSAAGEEAPAPSGPADAPAAAPAASEVLTRSLLFICRFEPGAGFDPRQRRILTESLLIKLGSAAADIRLRPYSGPELPADADLDRLAILSEADAWLLVSVSGNMDQARLRFQARDLQRDRDFFSTEIEAVLDSRFRAAFGNLWNPVAARMRDTIRPFRETTTLQVQGPPGGVLELDGGRQVVLDASGQASVALNAPASHEWKLYVPGFRAAGGTVFMEQSQALEIKPQARLPVSLSLGLEWLTYPMVSLCASILPDTLDLELSGIVSNLGLSPSNPTETGTFLFRDAGLFYLMGGLRWQILQHRYPAQLSLGLGAQLRYLTRGSLRLDPAIPGGFYLAIGTSLDIGPDCAVYFDLLPRLSFAKDAAAARSAQARGQQGASPGSLGFALDSVLIEPLHFAIGLRFQP